jgi:pimeloyl-ACP methyl ester carboxylesterase
VLLNAGLLHRVGPGRLYVSLARALSGLGFPVLRVDLFARGDSAITPDAVRDSTEEENYADIKLFIDARFGEVPVVLGGLCSGADNAIRLAIRHDEVVGLILLDPICFKTRGFALRQSLHRLQELFLHPAFSVRHAAAALTRILRAMVHASDETIDPLTIRNAPTRPEVEAAFSAVAKRGGHVLSIFTRYAMHYYNCQGQMQAIALPHGPNEISSEIFWPDVAHTYSLEIHRLRLIDAITTWCAKNFSSCN